MTEKISETSGSDSFLSRWSKRKQADNAVGESESSAHQSSVNPQTKTAEPNLADVLNVDIDDGSESLHALATPEINEQPLENEAETVAEEAEEPLLSDEDMPEITTLDSSSDMSPFFNRGVSTALRKAALNYVFSLPAYNIRDGLNDYDDDYTVFEPLGDTVTCDMKFHAERKEKLRLEEERLERERLAQEQLEQEQLETEQAEQAQAEQAQEEQEAPAEDVPADEEEELTVASEEELDSPKADAELPNDESTENQSRGQTDLEEPRDESEAREPDLHAKAKQVEPV